MTPIESPYDVRLTTLFNVAMDAIESLALHVNKDPEQLLSESLYRSTRRVHEMGEESIANKLLNCYPLLAEAVTEIKPLNTYAK